MQVLFFFRASDFPVFPFSKIGKNIFQMAGHNCRSGAFSQGNTQSAVLRPSQLLCNCISGAEQHRNQGLS